jgi:hypothetical protein
MSRIDRPRTNAPITIARSGSVQHLRAARKQPGDERLGGLADLRDLDLEFAHQRLQRARAINLAPSLASSDSDSCGFSPTPTANNRSICSSISADGGTVRLTA